MRLIEIPRRRSQMPPRLDKLAVLRKLHHPPRVVRIRRVPIRHEDIAIAPNRHPSRPIERIRTIPRHPLLAQHHQHLPRRTQLKHLLPSNHALRILRRHAQHCRFIVHIANP